MFCYDADLALQAMCIQRFRQFLDQFSSIRVMTISPHEDAKAGFQRIQELCRRGIIPALGHDKGASEAEILGALHCIRDHNLTLPPTQPHIRPHITHLFNVTAFHHRDIGLTNIVRTPPVLPFGHTHPLPSPWSTD